MTALADWAGLEAASIAVRARPDLEAVELILTVEGDSEQRFALAPLPAADLALRLIAASVRATRRTDR